MRIRKEILQYFRRRLMDFFRKSGRSELPWRREGITAYEVWVSEVMLQQTQVARVIGYYRRFLKKFPTVKKLSRATWEEFLPYYEGLGYYVRGRNMLRTAQGVMEEHSGEFPKTVPELEKLPGIGPYTARAIASFAYSSPELAWDTNVKRVIGRFFLGARDKIGEEEMITFNKRLGKEARLMNAALMDFGSAICTARPKCANCPLQTECMYYREQGKRESHLQMTKSRKAKPAQTERVMVFLHERHRAYYSSHTKTYRPFLLPRGFVTRAAIKDYFVQTYALSVAVRPPHREAIFQNETILLVHAQILLGTPTFPRFPKSAVLEYTEREKI